MPNIRPPGSAHVAYQPIPGIAIFSSITLPPDSLTFSMNSSRFGTGIVTCVIGLSLLICVSFDSIHKA